MDSDEAISYKLLRPGTPVLSTDGQTVGRVERVLENSKEHIFDGIVLETAQGLRFVDAPEVGRITAGSVTLLIDAEQAAALPEPDAGAPEYELNPRAGRVGRFFGGGWKKRK